MIPGKFAGLVLLLTLMVNRLPADGWSQFRGPNAVGIGADGTPLPEEIGPETNVLWKVPTPVGHSSPVLDDRNVYLTAVDDKTLLTLALDRKSGEERWRREAPIREIEQTHGIGNPAQSSPATDGDVVVSFFGSSGLLAYDAADGRDRWYLPMGPFHNSFGSGSSPILVDGRVILSQDHDTDSFLLAVDAKTGEVIWRTDRSEFPRGYATPVIWEVNGQKQIVVTGTLRVIGYDWETGEEIWTVRGLSRIVNMTPTAIAGGNLYVPAWAPGGDADNRIDLPRFAQAIEADDKDGDGMLSEDEITSDAGKQRFSQIDRDKDGEITLVEYEDMRQVFEDAHNVMVAIKPGGVGDITDTHVLWSQPRQLPYVPSPVYHDGQLFMVKNAGIFTAVDADTGEIGKSGRVFGKSSYFASPVLGDGKIYTVDDRGALTVLKASKDWKVASTASFDEPVHATPAIAAGRLYLRTAGHLYAFGFD